MALLTAGNSLPSTSRRAIRGRGGLAENSMDSVGVEMDDMMLLLGS